MPRPNMGKTKTIKERAIYVYLPSHKMTKDWKSRAEKAGVSISKFVIYRVEDSLWREEDEEGHPSRLELIGRLERAEDELKELGNENRLLKKLAENMDNELKRYRAMPFTRGGFEGVRRFDGEFVDLLRRGGSYTDGEILARLNIEPSDTELVKAVGKQLEILESYGLVEYVGGGWRWKR